MVIEVIKEYLNQKRTHLTNLLIGLATFLLAIVALRQTNFLEFTSFIKYTILIIFFIILGVIILLVYDILTD